MPRLIFNTPSAYSVAKIGLLLLLLLLKMHQAVEAEVDGRGVWSYYLQLWGTWTRGSSRATEPWTRPV